MFLPEVFIWLEDGVLCMLNHAVWRPAAHYEKQSVYVHRAHIWGKSTGAFVLQGGYKHWLKVNESTLFERKQVFTVCSRSFRVNNKRPSLLTLREFIAVLLNFLHNLYFRVTGIVSNPLYIEAIQSIRKGANHWEAFKAYSGDESGIVSHEHHKIITE